MKKAWKSLPEGVRSWISVAIKVVITFGAFYLLLTHEVEDGQGGRISVWGAAVTYVPQIGWRHLLPFALIATGIKLIGILSSMYRWQLLLRGQGIRFNFGHIFGAFLTGRFLGTFLPGTWGLDGYKLYDAARFSKRVVEPAAATALEKVTGMTGLFLTFLITLPLGYPILYQVMGDTADWVIPLIVAIAAGVVVGLFLLLFRPGIVAWGLGFVPAFGRKRLEGFVTRVSEAATAYRGKGRLLATVLVLGFVVHFTTAAMYYFTALAVRAVDIEFWYVAFGSSIQIFATVLSPVTIGGEGIREAAQMLLLEKHMGTVQAVLSAALGFWAAEAPTMLGAFYLWGRRSNYQPKTLELDFADSSESPDSSNSNDEPPGEQQDDTTPEAPSPSTPVVEKRAVAAAG